MRLLKQFLLPFSVFVTGASILIVEVVGVRVLSPFYGNTIFTVSSVISVILLALSCGYYAGGKLSDRHPTLSYFFSIIFISGLLLLAFYSLGTIALPLLSSRLSLTMGPLVSALLLFLLPSLLLGTLSPYAVKLQTISAKEQGVGSATGTIFFWSTVGSIAGSLAAGFLLIPHFGLDRILIANGTGLSALGAIGLAVLRVSRKHISFAVMAFAILFATSCFAGRRTTRRILYTKDGVYQKITIYDGEYAGRPTRFFQQDENNAGAGQGAMFLDSDDPSDLVYDYTRYYSLYKLFESHIENALVIGAGAYSVPKALLHDQPQAQVEVVDIEPSLFALAQRYFKVPSSPRLHNHVEDGRRFLQDSGKKYDLIFADVYYSFFSVPPHFATKEFFVLAKQRLTPNGVFVSNMIGDLSRQQPSLIMAEIKTFQAVFPNSYFFAVAWPERTDSQNVMLVGYNGDDQVDFDSPFLTANADALIRTLPSKRIDVGRRFDLSPYPVLTDNFSPIEFLTAKVLQRAFTEEKLLDGYEMAADVAQQRRYGPRYPDTAGHNKVRDFLLAEMKLLAQDVKTQTWAQTANGQKYESTNIISRFYAADRRVVFVAPYSGIAAPANTRNRSILIRNDGSGVAVLMELARAFEDSNVPPDVGIDLVFLDGDGEGGAQNDPAGAELSSARYFVEHLTDLYGNNKPVLAVLLGPLCGRNLQISKQPSLASAAPGLQRFWNLAEGIAPGIFQASVASITDNDLAPFVRAGIPSILLANSEYSRGKPVEYDGGNCSPRALEAVGEALLRYVTTPEQSSRIQAR